MSGPAKKFDIDRFFHPGSQVKKLEIEGPEDPDDKKFRLTEKYWTFFVKGLAAYALSFLFVLIIGIYCL